MKIKVSLLITAVGILKAIDMTKMKLSTSYKVRQILNKCEDAIQDFQAVRINLAEKHGKLNEEETQYEFSTDESREAFQDELSAVMEDEIDMDIKPIHIDLLDDYLDIEPSNVDYVSWFIEGFE
jgi:hypothetical protein